MAYNQPFIVCDVETGGLPSKLKKEAVTEVALTEIAFVVLDNSTLEIVDKVSWLIKPYSDSLVYDPYAAKVSGIDKKMCEEDGQDIKEVYKEVVAFLKKYVKGKKKAYLVGQNIINFDLEFIDNFFELCGGDASKFFDPDIKDTQNVSREKWCDENKHNLGIICERLNIPYVHAHRALPDTIMTAKVWVAFMKLLRGGGEVVKKEVEKTRVTFEM